MVSIEKIRSTKRPGRDGMISRRLACREFGLVRPLLRAAGSRLCREMEQTLGLPVKEAGLYFVQLEKYVRV